MYIYIHIHMPSQAYVPPLGPALEISVPRPEAWQATGQQWQRHEQNGRGYEAGEMMGRCLKNVRMKLKYGDVRNDGMMG